ncbi:universal stress protein [Streptomyces caeruleatus]
MPHDIAVGVDGTSASLAAAHWAAHEAQRRGSGLTMLHAWYRHPRPAPDVPFGRTEHDWAEEILREAVHSVRSAHPDLKVTERLVCDATVTVLVAADCDMLVLGSLGLGSFAGFVTGSVSQRVVARSTRPVVLVRAGRGAAEDHLPAADGVAPEEIPRTPYREVVLGLHNGHPCDELIDFAFDAARRRDTGLRVVHAFRTPGRGVSDASLFVAPPGSPDPVPGPPVVSTAQARADAERALTAVLGAWREKYPTVPVTESVIEGRATVALVHAARDASLLVVGRRGAGRRMGAHTGPVVHAVLHHAACPVAVVPHE